MAVAQLVEPRIVIPVVVGSSPISHPIPRFIFHFSILVVNAQICLFLCACLLDYCAPITENFALIFLTSAIDFRFASQAPHLAVRLAQLGSSSEEQGFPIKLMYKIDEDFHAGFC